MWRADERFAVCASQLQAIGRHGVARRLKISRQGVTASIIRPLSTYFLKLSALSFTRFCQPSAWAAAAWGHTRR